MKVENSKFNRNFQNLRNQTNLTEELKSELQNIILTNIKTEESLKVPSETQCKSKTKIINDSKGTDDKIKVLKTNLKGNRGN